MVDPCEPDRAVAGDLLPAHPRVAEDAGHVRAHKRVGVDHRREGDGGDGVAERASGGVDREHDQYEPDEEVVGRVADHRCVVEQPIEMQFDVSN